MDGKLKHISVRVTLALYDQIQAKAEASGEKVAEFVRNHLRQICHQAKATPQVSPDVTEALCLQLTAKDEQIDHTHQVVAMSQKNIGALTEQLDDSRQMIEDMRQRRTVWQRIRGVFVAETA